MGVYRIDGSPYFHYSFKIPGRSQVRGSTRTTDRKLALQVYHAKRSQYQKVDYGFERPKVKIRQLIDDFMTLHSKPSKITWKDDEERLERVGHFLGMDTLLFEVTTAKLEEYRATRLGEGVSKSTVNREISVLKTAWNKAEEWGRATSNPVTKIKFYSEKDNAKTRFLDNVEKVRLLNACPTPTKRLVFFALNTGIRLGSILKLKWRDIDYNTNLIAVRRSKSGRTYFVPMSGEVEDMLKSMPSLGEYVFQGPESQGSPKWGFYRMPFEKAVKQSGLAESGVTFHTLRHTFASDLTMKGNSEKTVAELLGHASTRMTARYSHLSPGSKLAAVEMLPKGLFYQTGIKVEDLAKQKSSVL